MLEEQSKNLAPSILVPDDGYVETPEAKSRRESVNAELDRRQQAAVEDLNNQEKKFTGAITGISSIRGTDYVAIVTSTGQVATVYRHEVFQRSMAILQMLEREVGDADPAQIDKDIWLMHKAFHVALQNGRERGENTDSTSEWRDVYQKTFIRRFDRYVKRLESEWKQRGLSDPKLVNS